MSLIKIFCRSYTLRRIYKVKTYESIIPVKFDSNYDFNTHFNAKNKLFNDQCKKIISNLVNDESPGKITLTKDNLDINNYYEFLSYVAINDLNFYNGNFKVKIYNNVFDIILRIEKMGD